MSASHVARRLAPSGLRRAVELRGAALHQILDVVIPDRIRKEMGLTFGSKLIVITDGSNLLLKPMEEPKIETFKKLIDFVSSLTEEEADTKREGLTEEQKAIFDLLRKPELSDPEKKKIKEIAIDLLEELKKDKLKVEQWADKTVTAAAVFNAVSKMLFELLPYPTYQTDEVDLKTNLVYEHLKHQYYGGGLSIYGPY